MGKKKDRKTVHISATIPVEVKELLLEIAREEDRSLGSLIRIILSDWLDNNQ